MRFSVPNHVLNRAVDQHDFKRGFKSAIQRWQQLLADDGAQYHGELNANLLLLIGGKHVDDAVNRLRRADGMQRTEHELAGFGGGQRGLNRIQIAHFAEQNYVWRLAQCRAKSGFVALRVVFDFALGYHALLMRVDKLNRVLNRNDVPAPALVDAVDDAGKRRRLSARGGPGDKHQSLLQIRKLQDLQRNVHVLRIGERQRNHAQHHGIGVALLIGIAAEAPDAADGERKIVVALLNEPNHLAMVQIVHLLNEPLGIVRLKDDVQQRQHFAGNLDANTRAGDDEHIRPAFLDRRL